MPNRILAYERIAAIASVPHWTAEHATEMLTRAFAFDNKDTRNRFVADVEAVADAIGHGFQHVFDGNVVRITLTTPEVGGLSELDVDLAQAIDSLFEDKC